METLAELAKGDKKNIESIAKQKGLSAIFKSLKTHNGDENLSTKAEQTLKKLMEEPEGKEDMKEDMNEKVKDLDSLAGKTQLNKEELKKASEATNGICNYMMNENMADVASEQGSKTISNLRNFWAIRKKEEIELQSTGSRAYEYKKDITNLAKASQRALKSVKPGDKVAIENFKASMLLEEAIQTFKKDHMDTEISQAMLKLINQAVEHPDLHDHALDKCNAADLVPALNASFDAHKDNFELMKDLITLAVELCLKYSEVASRIDGRALIKQLLDNGRLFLKKGIEEPKNISNTKAVTNCLKAFSKTEENLKIMQENKGLEYFNSLKDSLAKLMSKKSTYSFQNSFERINKIKNDSESIFETTKLKPIEIERAVSSSLLEIIDRYQNQFNLLPEVFPNLLDLLLPNLEDQEPTKTGLGLLLKAF